MRHYIVTIVETLGEYEFSTEILVSAKNENSVIKKLNRITETFRDAPEISTEFQTPKEVSKMDFEVLKRFVTELD